MYVYEYDKPALVHGRAPARLTTLGRARVVCLFVSHIYIYIYIYIYIERERERGGDIFMYVYEYDEPALVHGRVPARPSHCQRPACRLSGDRRKPAARGR